MFKYPPFAATQAPGASLQGEDPDFGGVAERIADSFDYNNKPLSAKSCNFAGHRRVMYLLSCS